MKKSMPNYLILLGITTIFCCLMNINAAFVLEAQEEANRKLPYKTKADRIVTLYNANVPIEAVYILENDGLLRGGLSANVWQTSTEHMEHPLWYIPIRDEKRPFTLTIMAGGRPYKYKIRSFELCFGDELVLIQKNTFAGPKLSLQQMGEEIGLKRD